MPEDRRCAFKGCREQLARKLGETDWSWGRRRYCDRACASKARADRNGQIVWTVGMIEATRELCQAGRTAQEIADALEELGYPAVSRNAVIGIIHRRGLRDRPPEKPTPAAVSDETRRRIQAEAAREKPAFACETPGCRNTKQPGRDQCASCIGARLSDERAQAKINEGPYRRVG